MPLKQIDDPEKDKKPPKDKKPSGGGTGGSDNTDPWKYLEDGTKVRQGRKLPFENSLRELFDAVAGGVKLADSFSGQVIENQAEELAYGYARLAKEDPKVKAFFEKLVTGSAYSAVVIPTAVTVIPILWHFGLMPAKLGVPVTLAAGMMPFTREQEQAAMAQQQQEQAQAAQQQERATHPHGEAPGDGDES